MTSLSMIASVPESETMFYRIDKHSHVPHARFYPIAASTADRIKPGAETIFTQLEIISASGSIQRADSTYIILTSKYAPVLQMSDVKSSLSRSHRKGTITRIRKPFILNSKADYKAAPTWNLAKEGRS